MEEDLPKVPQLQSGMLDSDCAHPINMNPAIFWNIGHTGLHMAQWLGAWPLETDSLHLKRGSATF